MDNLDEYMSTLTDKTSFNLHSATMLDSVQEDKT